MRVGVGAGVMGSDLARFSADFVRGESVSAVWRFIFGECSAGCT